jgi:hypothetical protein
MKFSHGSIPDIIIDSNSGGSGIIYNENYA